MEVVSYRQSVFLLSMIMPVTGHFLLLPTIFSMAGHEAWVAIILAMPLGFFLGFIIFRLHTIYPDSTFGGMLRQTFGKMAGKLMILPLAVYFLYLIIITFYGIVDFVQVIFLPETPRWVIGTVFYLIVFYALFVGIENVTRISEALLPFIVITGFAIAITTLGEKDFKNLLPIFEKGFFSLFDAIILTVGLYGEMTLLLMVQLRRQYERSQSLLFTNSILVLLIAIMFLGTVTGTLAVFGEQFVKTLEYPAQSIVRLVSFGFVERFDIYGIAVIVFGGIIRISVLHRSIGKGLELWFKGRGKWGIHVTAVALVVFFTVFGIKNYNHFISVYISKYYPLTVLISFFIPVFTWMIAEIRRRHKRSKAT
ncbi:endospore germination permease [Bacillus sp. ISL-47]|uniref:GerAB/ArcD/ProY family transporter n=1 Tax=Bacillus sp. ISL-47 TaxID=2819130 RepID=UPI001BE8356B|nr:endospore germination permease [Bacillus sp. ISL-47]MBT2706928.1 endospore germination permease [Pseudomonas sp. ISL-84]